MYFLLLHWNFLCIFSLFAALGEPACGFCVFYYSIQVKVHSSHSAGVSHHVTSGVAVRAQAQQKADLLLLASYCG